MRSSSPTVGWQRPTTLILAGILVGVLLGSMLAIDPSRADYHEKLIDASFRETMGAEARHFHSESAEIKALLLDYAETTPSLVLKARLVIDKYGDDGREILARYGTDPEFARVLDRYGENVVPVIDYFTEHDPFSVRAVQKARQIAGALWQKAAGGAQALAQRVQSARQGALDRAVRLMVSFVTSTDKPAWALRFIRNVATAAWEGTKLGALAVARGTGNLWDRAFGRPRLSVDIATSATAPWPPEVPQPAVTAAPTDESSSRESGETAATLEHFGPTERGWYAIQAIDESGYDFLGQFRIARDNKAVWIQSERALEGAASLVGSGIRNLEVTARTGEKIEAADVFWAAVDGAIVLGFVQSLRLVKTVNAARSSRVARVTSAEARAARAVEAGAASGTAKLLPRQATVWDETKVLGRRLFPKTAFGRKMLAGGAAAGMTYLIIRYPGLVNSLMEHVANLWGINPYLVKFLFWAALVIIAYLVVWLAARILLGPAIYMFRALRIPRPPPHHVPR